MKLSPRVRQPRTEKEKRQTKNKKHVGTNAARGRRFRFFLPKAGGANNVYHQEKQKRNYLHTPETHGSQNTGNIILTYALAFHKQLLYATNCLPVLLFFFISFFLFCPRRRSPSYKKSQRKPENLKNIVQESTRTALFLYKFYMVYIRYEIPSHQKCALQKKKKMKSMDNERENGRETRNI